MIFSTKIIIDTSSLLDLFKYYQFDRIYGGNKIYNKLISFFYNKINSKEIIVIDKVYDEIFSGQKYIDDFKKSIKKNIISTTSLLNQVKELSNEKISEIEEKKEKFNIDKTEFYQKLDKYESQDADLYLIQFCEKLKLQNINAILITEESKRNDKLLPKIPSICKDKNINCKNLPYLLFKHYKEELNFNLEIIPLI